MGIKTGKKTSDILEALIVLMLLINLNLLISSLNIRLDLTEEKRYTISPPTITLLRALEDVVYVEVYLEGKFPPGFQRLQKATRETLEGFNAYAGNKIQYKFIDPSEVKGAKGRQDLINYLGRLGIQPTNLYASEDGKRTEKLIFPGAVISYNGAEAGIMLLKGNKASPPQEQLNQSIESVEYELARTIKKLADADRKKIGMVTGHGELNSTDVVSANKLMAEYYDVIPINLGKTGNMDEFDALIIAKPVLPYTQNEIYAFDQYIMRGGKALIMADMLHVEKDSIGKEGTIGFPLETNLDELLFRYGIRINRDFVIDLNSGGVPVVVGNMGTEPQYQLLQWPYYPVLNQFGEHPIVRNLDAIYGRFVNSIDTITTPGIKKVPLVFSSPYTRIVPAPVAVTLNDLRSELKPELFNFGQVAVSWLLEGEFTSVFRNRILPPNAIESDFRPVSTSTSIIVFSDGDVIRNEINPGNGTPYDLGYDPFLQANFANSDFLLNALAYLAENDGLVTARSKEIQIRPLDKVKIENEKGFWQAVNLTVPVMAVILFGVLRFIIRRKRFAAIR